MMLHKNKTSGKLRSIIATSLAVAALTGIVTMQSCEQKIENERKIIKYNEPIEGVYTLVHKMPEPPYKLHGFLATHLVYPQEARDKGIEGRIIVKFVVDEKGHITNITPAQINYNPLLADAAVKAVAQMPDWTPGEDEKSNKVKVKYNLPIIFKLGGDDEKPKTSKISGEKKKADMVVRYPGKDSDATFKIVKMNVNKEEFGHKLRNGGITMVMERSSTPEVKTGVSKEIEEVYKPKHVPGDAENEYRPYRSEDITQKLQNEVVEAVPVGSTSPEAEEARRLLNEANNTQ